MVSSIQTDQAGIISRVITAISEALRALARAVNNLFHRIIPTSTASTTPVAGRNNVNGSMTASIPVPIPAVCGILTGRISQYSFAGGTDACAPIAAGMIDALLRGPILTRDALDALVVAGVARYAEVFAAAKNRGWGSQCYLDAHACIEFSPELRLTLCEQPWTGHVMALTAAEKEVEDYEKLLEILELFAMQYEQSIGAFLVIVPFTHAVHFNQTTGQYTFVDSHGRGVDTAVQLRTFSSKKALAEHLVIMHPYVDSDHQSDLNRCALHVVKRARL